MPAARGADVRQRMRSPVLEALTGLGTSAARRYQQGSLPPAVARGSHNGDSC
jgi:hypothetical protein